MCARPPRARSGSACAAEEPRIRSRDLNSVAGCSELPHVEPRSEADGPAQGSKRPALDASGLATARRPRARHRAPLAPAASFDDKCRGYLVRSGLVFPSDTRGRSMPLRYRAKALCPPSIPFRQIHSVIAAWRFRAPDWGIMRLASPRARVRGPRTWLSRAPLPRASREVQRKPRRRGDATSDPPGMILPVSSECGTA
ncbi:hypothetical protein DFJ74DRAFT_375430 [Hyaloraphidium curvatum]|nr:hypothetical protein DFJ74DRAFT_375430 [Hyaloraphidium curvatum]